MRSASGGAVTSSAPVAAAYRVAQATARRDAAEPSSPTATDRVTRRAVLWRGSHPIGAAVITLVIIASPEYLRLDYPHCGPSGRSTPVLRPWWNPFVRTAP
ncbi:hypothetical protein GCM10009660_58490 [Catellatospora bangladeshensis]